MAQTSMRDRIIAGLGAIFFLVSASAFTVFVLVDMFRANKDQPTDTSVACEAQKVEAKQEAPEIYKTDAAVTDLQIQDLEVGTGQAAGANDCLVVKYYGTLAKDGTKFDENYTQPSAFAFRLGTGAVIKGWDRGLEGMKVGGTRRLVIPANLGYGEQSAGSIPANSDLVFTVELLRINK